MNRARRCLLVEGLSHHWEVLPPWVGMLQQLGYDVEVAADVSSSGHRETLTLLQSRCRTHQAAEVQNLPLDDFDFVVLNSLVHEGYFFHEPTKPRPNLKWIQDLGLPSISIVHEPVLWVEKRITHSFHEVGDNGRQWDSGRGNAGRWIATGCECLKTGGRGFLKPGTAAAPFMVSKLTARQR